MKNIENYSNYYIFKNGDVFSKERIVNSRFKTRKKKGFIMKHHNSIGYPFVVLFNKEGRKLKLIHRLLSESFIPNPENKPCVHHINHNKGDFRLENLMWVTHKENILFAVNEGKMSGHYNRGGYKILQYTKDGTFVKEWKSTMDAERNLGLYNTNISLVCRGIRKTTGGFIFKYKKDGTINN